jgi:hypothetical protein
MLDLCETVQNLQEPPSFDRFFLNRKPIKPHPIGALVRAFRDLDEISTLNIFDPGKVQNYDQDTPKTFTPFGTISLYPDALKAFSRTFSIDHKYFFAPFLKTTEPVKSECIYIRRWFDKKTNQVVENCKKSMGDQFVDLGTEIVYSFSTGETEIGSNKNRSQRYKIKFLFSGNNNKLAAIRIEYQIDENKQEDKTNIERYVEIPINIKSANDIIKSLGEKMNQKDRAIYAFPTKVVDITTHIYSHNPSQRTESVSVAYVRSSENRWELRNARTTLQVNDVDNKLDYNGTTNLDYWKKVERLMPPDQSLIV